MAETEVTIGRRRVPRRLFEGAVGVLRHGQFALQRSYQVGEGGMMVSVNEGLREGQRIVLSFYLPGSTMIIVRGVVRSLLPAKDGYPPRCGLEFENLGFQHKREIRNFVAAATRSDSYIGL